MERVPKDYAGRIRALALSFPEAYEDSPWGFPVFKVAENKMFAWLDEGDPVEVTMKLTREEREIAELLPFTRRASYVGRYGWNSVDLAGPVPDDEVLELVDLSYEAIVAGLPKSKRPG
jgi:predicted DNA-binding protein (MmcQ/YjbR family)